MKIGIYGGTFDPPHLGHMEAACAAVGFFGLDKLLLIPSAIPPHKFLPEDSAGTEHRLAMTKIMADGVGELAEVLELEILREGPSYTVDTVRALRKDYPDAEFFLLMGTDMFFAFEQWYEAGELAKEVTLAPFAREESGSHELFAVQCEQLKAQLGAKISVLPLPKIYPISSTQVRRLLKGSKTREPGGALLWTPIYGYILRNRLYGCDTDLTKLSEDQLRAVAYSMVQAKRVPHIQGTEEAAVLLAQRWNVDPKRARRAAILHDCTKHLDLEAQRALCTQYQIDCNELERGSAKLLHARTGAAVARHVFGADDEIVQAIDSHTTGAPGMTTFDKVLYLADYIEPNRGFPGVEELRRLSYEDLDAAMCRGLETTIAELEAKNATVHENTKQTLLQLKGQ